DKDDLRIVVSRNAAHKRSRGLHLVRDDRHLCADELVDERRLARIRSADQRHEAGAGCRSFYILVAHASVSWSQTPSRTSMAAAAACSASRLERPDPVAGATPAIFTETSNTGS